MKSIRSLRLLSLLGFLLLMAPFYEQCSMKKAEAPAEEVMVDTTAVEMPVFENDTLIVDDTTVKDSIIDVKIKEPSFYQKGYEFIDDRNNFNAFELAYVSKDFFEGSFSKFREELSKDFKRTINDLFYLIRSVSFVFIVLISFSIFLLSLSLFKRVKWINRLAISNLILLLITIIIILFFDPFFETYKQIKWGYYAFTLVQIGIYYSSKLQISEA